VAVSAAGVPGVTPPPVGHEEVLMVGTLAEAGVIVMATLHAPLLSAKSLSFTDKYKGPVVVAE
jgi:hypothetical protein